MSFVQFALMVNGEIGNAEKIQTSKTPIQEQKDSNRDGKPPTFYSLNPFDIKQIKRNVRESWEHISANAIPLFSSFCPFPAISMESHGVNNKCGGIRIIYCESILKWMEYFFMGKTKTWAIKTRGKAKPWIIWKDSAWPRRMNLWKWVFLGQQI